MKRPYIIAEIGINHNGNLAIAKKLIDMAKSCGCDAVKFQKRDVELVYAPEDLDKHRESPFGNTNREQKTGLELGLEDFKIIDDYCKKSEIDWFASCWDLNSLDFINQFNPKYHKLASAMLTVLPLVEAIAKTRIHTFISTGMSEETEIDRVVDIFKRYECPFELMHCHSSYPMKPENANLAIMQYLKNRYKCRVGYSGHEVGLSTSLIAVALGADSIERHITLDRSMYGSDQAASLEEKGLRSLVRDIRLVTNIIGDGKKRIDEIEKESRKKLSNVYWNSK